MKFALALGIVALSLVTSGGRASATGTADDVTSKPPVASEIDRANAAYARGEYREASADIERAALAPGAEEFAYDIWFVRSEISVTFERYDDAIAQAEKASLVRPDAANPHAIVADASFAKGDVARAKAEYLEAAKLDPELLKEYVDYAFARETLKRRDSATAAFYADVALGIDPANQMALDVACDAAYYLEDGHPTPRAEAIRHCDAAIATGRRSASSSVVFTDRASLEQESGLFARALADIGESFALQPNPARSTEYYVRSYVRTNPGKHRDLKGALADVTRAISMKDAAEYHWLRAEIYERLADWTKAKSDFVAYGNIYPPFKTNANREVAKIDDYLANRTVVMRSTPFYASATFSGDAPFEVDPYRRSCGFDCSYDVDATSGFQPFQDPSDYANKDF